MKALDTNVIIRFLVKDDEKQAKAVHGLFSKAEQEKYQFFISAPVLLETLWVLESVYQFPRNRVIDAIDVMLLLPILEFEHHSSVRQFVMNARETKIDLSDLLIACVSTSAVCPSVFTFDKKAARHDLFELIHC